MYIIIKIHKANRTWRLLQNSRFANCPKDVLSETSENKYLVQRQYRGKQCFKALYPIIYLYAVAKNAIVKNVLDIILSHWHIWGPGKFLNNNNKHSYLQNKMKLWKGNLKG